MTGSDRTSARQQSLVPVRQTSDSPNMSETASNGVRLKLTLIFASRFSLKVARMLRGDACSATIGLLLNSLESRNKCLCTSRLGTRGGHTKNKVLCSFYFGFVFSTRVAVFYPYLQDQLRLVRERK